MKVSKLFTLDIEIIHNLQKEKNASKLISDLLLEYYNEGSGLKKEELKVKKIKKLNIINQTKIEIEKIEDTITKIEDRDKMIKETFKNIPTEILDDFKVFKFTEQSLFIRHSEIYIKKFKFTFNELKKAWLEFNE